jgi:hypothetical protein
MGAGTLASKKPHNAADLRINRKRLPELLGKGERDWAMTTPTLSDEQLRALRFLARHSGGCVWECRRAMSEADRYTLVVRARRSTIHPRPWGWKICRDGQPLPARLREVGFKTEQTATAAGKVAPSGLPRGSSTGRKQSLMFGNRPAPRQPSPLAAGSGVDQMR